MFRRLCQKPAIHPYKPTSAYRQHGTCPAGAASSAKGALTTDSMLFRAGEEGAALQEPQGPAKGTAGRKVSTADIQLVQNLIERCLQVCAYRRLYKSPHWRACWCAGAAVVVSDAQGWGNTLPWVGSCSA